MISASLLFLLLFIIIGIVIYIYLGTDTFKSDKDLFIKHTSQLFEENNFIPTGLAEYLNKKQNQIYETKGTFKINVNYTDPSIQEQKEEEIYNNMYIDIEGKVDKVSSRDEVNLIVNYSDSAKFPISYKHDGNKSGIKIDDILPNYIASNSNDINEVFEEIDVIGGTDFLIDPTYTLPIIELTNDEKVYIQDVYVNNFFTNLSEDKFTIIENTDGSNCYELNLTLQEATDIISQTLQTASQDTKIINILNKIFSSNNLGITITPDNIIELKNRIDSEKIEDGNFKVQLNENNKIINKIRFEISLSDSNNSENEDYMTAIEIVKNSNSSDNLSYTVNYTIAGTQIISTSINLVDYQTNNPSEKVTISVGNSENSTFSYMINNNLTFENQIAISEFEDASTIVIDNYQENELNNFLTQYKNKFIEFHRNMMTQIGLVSSDAPFSSMRLLPIIIVGLESSGTLRGFYSYNDSINSQNSNDLSMNDTFNSIPNDMTTSNTTEHANSSDIFSYDFNNTITNNINNSFGTFDTSTFNEMTNNSIAEQTVPTAP